MDIHSGVLISVPMPEAREGITFPATMRAVRRAGELLHTAWLMKANNDLVGRSSGDYVAGLRTPESLQHPYDADSMAVGVFNVAPHATAIEYGHDGYNLAARINWGDTPKSRYSKETGLWYIYVPFRHYTPARAGEGATLRRIRHSMPETLYQVAKRMTADERMMGDRHHILRSESTIRGPGRRVIAHRGIGAKSKRYVVPLGGLPQSARSAGAIQTALRNREAPDPFHKQSTYEGMFKSGMKGHTQYMTIRTLTQESQWWMPARPGKFAARKVASENGVVVRGMIQEAFAKDVERSLALGFVSGGG